MNEYVRPFSLILCAVIVWLGISTAINMARARQSNPLETESIPTPAANAVESGWADESTCIDCHDQAEDFGRTGHARTLTTASDDVSWSALRQLSQSKIGDTERVSVARTLSGKILAQRIPGGGTKAQIPLDWCFGSGAHARTWVTTLTDSLGQTDLLEFRWTWYQHSQDFDLTPGQPDQCGAGHLPQFGLQFDGARAWRCFACHSTRLPSKAGQLSFEKMHPGVTCQNCHGPRQAHVASNGLSRNPAWEFKDRDQQVARCAECHRDSAEQKPETIRHGNPDIARFQPIGLSRSMCFLKSDMSCTTCHNVHRPMSSQFPRRISQCTQCHDSEASHQTSCSAGMMDRCIDCHMPALDTGRGLEFVDHWIRIPDEQDGQQ